MSVDTACSSSLVTVHLAVRDLHQGITSEALSMSTNVLFMQNWNLALSTAGMLAEDGRCKTLDGAANGYVRSEAFGILYIVDISSEKFNKVCIPHKDDLKVQLVLNAKCPSRSL